MTDTAKHYVYVGGAVAGLGVLIYALHLHAQAATQAASDSSGNGLASSNAEALLQEEALAGSGGGFATTAISNTGLGISTPNFASDLEASLGLLQQAGLMPTPVSNAPNAPVEHLAAASSPTASPNASNAPVEHLRGYFEPVDSADFPRERLQTL